jgi:hypothetical protein
MYWDCSANLKAGICGGVVPALVFLSFAIAPAFAGDLSLKFGSFETIKLTDNLELSESNRDAALTTSTGFSLDMLNLGKTYKMEFTPGLSIQRTFFDEDPSGWKYYPSAGLAFSKSTKLTTYDLTASVSQSQATTNDLVEDIVTTNKGDRLDYSVGASISHKLNNSDFVSWSNFGRVTDYTLTSPSLVPYREFTSEARWHHQLSELIATDLVGSANYYDPDFGSGRRLYRSSLGVNARLTKRLTIDGTVGAIFLETDDSGLTVDALLSMAATYALKDTILNASISRSISPGINGNLLDSYSARLGATHQVNDLTSVGISTGYTLQSSNGGSKSSAFSISPSLKYQLAPDWSSVVAYQFTHTNGKITSAYSNAVTLSLSYNTTLLP